LYVWINSAEGLLRKQCVAPLIGLIVILT